VTLAPLALALVAFLQADLERVLAELEVGRYRNAWSAAGELADPLLRCRARSAILFRAGDHAGALRAAAEGLEIAPADPELLQRAAAAAIWSRDAARAQDLVERLRRASAVSSLAPEQRAGWAQAADDLARWSAELVERERARLRAIARARITVLILLGGALAGLFWFATRPLAR
jgi:hypothetical protein